MKRLKLFIGSAAAMALTFSLSASAGPLTGKSAQNLVEQLIKAGQSQLNYVEAQAYKKTLIERGYSPRENAVKVEPSDAVQNPAQDLAAGQLTNYTFVIENEYSGNYVKSNGKPLMVMPTLRLRGQFAAKCAWADEQLSCSVVPATVWFGSFEVSWKEMPPIGGSSSSAGGRD